MAAPLKYSDRSHARIYGHWEHLPAWQTLSVYGRAILTILLLDYRAGQNFLELSDAQASIRTGMARATAARAIEELQEKGWIGIARVGKMKGKRAGRCSAYFLKTYSEEMGIPAAHDYKRWRP